MNWKVAKAGAVTGMALMVLFAIAPPLIQGQVQNNQDQDVVKQKIDCVLCKILNLAALMSVPLTFIVVLPLFLLGLAASIISRDKWKKAQSGAKEKRNAKWIMIVSILFTALMLSGILLAGVLFAFAAVSNNCRTVCLPVFI